MITAPLVMLSLGIVALGIWYATRPSDAALPWQLRDSVSVVAPATASATTLTPSPLRIATYNMGYASGIDNNRGHIVSRETVIQNLDQIVATLAALDADVIVLQEVDWQSRRGYDINQLDYIQQRLDHPYWAFAVTWNIRYLPWPFWPIGRWYGPVISGQAVLSRIPITEQSVVRFPRPSIYPWWHNWFYLDRVAQQITFADPQRGSWQLWHAHLEAYHRGTRLAQMRQCANLMASNRSMPTLFAGDLNADAVAPGDAAQWLSTHTPLRCAATRHAPTFPSWAPLATLDQVFHSPHWRCTHYATVTASLASDHLPVVSEYTLS